MTTRSDIYAAAVRFVGMVKERPGADSHPFIEWAHELCRIGANVPDEVPWCSSGLNAICFVLGVPRSGSAAARSWLKVGQSIALDKAEPGDIAVFKRGSGAGAAGKETIIAPGHVAVFDRYDNTTKLLHVIGGNQGNEWSRGKFSEAHLLDIRRIA